MIRKPADTMVSTSRPNATTPTNRDQSRAASRKAADRTNPKTRGRRTRSPRGIAFVAFAEELRREIEPQGTLEELLADIAVQAAWDLKNGRGSETTLLKSIDTLDRLRRRRVLRTSSRVSCPAPEPEPMSDPDRAARLGVAPVHVEGLGVDPDSQAETDTEDVEVDTRWRDRLIFDTEISDVSPVIRGTWITVSHVVALVVDGWSWADILRAHPELIEDDVRACLAWTVEQEGAFHVDPSRVDRSNPDRSGR